MLRTLLKEEEKRDCLFSFVLHPTESLGHTEIGAWFKMASTGEVYGLNCNFDLH